MRKHVRATRATLALERLVQMPMIRTGHLSLASHAWQLRGNLSFYDALYVALAAKLGAPLVTLDARLKNAPKLPAEVVLIY